MRDERTLQYLVIESSTARAALACVVPGAVMVKCKMAEARRRGLASTRCASIVTWCALTGVRCLCSIVTTSVDAQVAMDTSSTSKGAGCSRCITIDSNRGALRSPGLELKATDPLHFNRCRVRDSR